jgi:two-component system chemotaxis response regulator CheY
MIVDDATIMRMRLKDILEAKFEIVAEASDGAQALTQYKLYRPDFVTLDITMPHVDGIETLGNILAFDPNAKVVIVSAVGQKSIVFDALAKGAKDFIVKPFDHDRVILAVDRLFSQ